MSVMSAASMATSVPVPMAMPTSAWASAGASLMPSPTMATTLPPACSSLTSSAFCSGSTSARTSSMPDLARRWPRPCAALSPVSIATSRPSCLEAADGRPRLGLSVSATAIGPDRPSTATNMTAVLPSPARSRRGGELAGGRPARASACVAQQHRVAVHRRADAVPGDRLEASVAGRKREPALRGGTRRSASPSGCSEPCSAAAARRSSSSLSNRSPPQRSGGPSTRCP